MPKRSRRRAGAVRIEARHRAAHVAGRLGRGLRESRQALGARQVDVAAAAGVSQSWVSRMERGAGQAASIETWVAVAAASGTQLAAYLEGAPGATRPRDYEHLKRQQLVIDLARGGGWTARAEAAIDPGWTRSRSVDVLLERRQRREVAIVEIWDFFEDVGAAWRGLDQKIATLARSRTDRTVSGLVVVRGTRRNRELVREFGSLFRTHFPASSAAWLRTFAGPAAMPTRAGFLWTDVRGTRLIAARL